MTTDPARKLDTALANCMKCGFCKAACPVFADEETTSPRAKVRLAKAVVCGDMELSSGVKQQMERCLNCRACASECPSGVEPNKIALAMRSAVVERDGLPLIKKLVFRTGLPRPWLVAAGSRFVSVMQPLADTNAVRSMLPMLGLRRDRHIPLFQKQPLLSVLPEIIEPYGEHKITVVYFPGCATNLVYHETGHAVVEALRKLGARVIMPRDLVCCSTPVFNSGDLEGARELAKRNIDILSGVKADLVVTSCGSCGLTIRREWTDVLELPEAAGIASKVIDIHEFVARYASERSFTPVDGDQKVTYHDSCHLRRGLGVFREPRELLKAALGDRFVEMEQAERCCGGGGMFSLYHPELSQVVAETKMACLAASGAGVVATGCPACIMQIRDSVAHRGMAQRVVHSIEIVNGALALG